MAVEGVRDWSSTYPVMAACCLLMLVDNAAATSDPRLIELLQKLKEPSRDRLLKVVFCTQVSPTATCNSVNRPSVRIEAFASSTPCEGFPMGSPIV